MRNIKNNFVYKCGFLFYISICLMVIFIVNVSVVNAEENTNIVDFSRKGSISITMSDSLENNMVEGAVLTIYKVADATNRDNNIDFDYPESLEFCKTELDNGNITSEVLECVINSGVDSYSATSSENGVVYFGDLDLGLYLVTQTNKVEGYSKIDSFLVMIPEVVDNSWSYDIVATPKVDIVRLFDLTVEKVWNVTNDNDIVDEITVELLKYGEVIDTVILNEDNDWNYTWEQIEKSDKYSVREVDVPVGYTVSYRKEGNKFIITNTKSLVQTGKSVWIVRLLALLGMLFIVIGNVLQKRKKYE